MECTECKYRMQIALKRCKHFELGGDKKRKVTIEVKVTLAVMKQLKQLQRKPRKKLWGFNRIQTHDPCNTSAMLYQLSYEVSLDAGQVIPLIMQGEWNDVCMIDHMSVLWIKNTSDSDPRSYEATKAVTKKAHKKNWGFNWSLLSFITSILYLQCIII